MRQAIEERFEAKVERIPFYGCWAWMGALNERGYGVIGRGARGQGNEKAHRLAYRLYRGEIPEGKYMLHKCGNPGCVNPWHLEPGTQKENMADMIRMGRHYQPDNSGENATWAKLNAEQAKEIKSAKERTMKVAAQFAEKFNVSKSAIRRIWEGKNWAKL